MGLIQDLSNTVGTFTGKNAAGDLKISQYGADIGKSFLKSTRLVDSDFFDQKNQMISTNNQAEPALVNRDVRGLPQFFRAKNEHGETIITNSSKDKNGKEAITSNIYTSTTGSLRQIFQYNKNFFCDNIEYFNTYRNKDYKPHIIPVKLYEFQPYSHIELGTLWKEIAPAFSKDPSKREAYTKDFLDNAVKHFFQGKGMLRNAVIDRVAIDTTTFYTNDEMKSRFADQMTMIKNMFRFGHWLNIYELPLYVDSDSNSPSYFNFGKEVSTWEASSR